MIFVLASVMIDNYRRKSPRAGCAEVYRKDEQKAASFTPFGRGTWRL